MNGLKKLCHFLIKWWSPMIKTARSFFPVHFKTYVLLKKVFSMKFNIHWYIIHVFEKNILPCDALTRKSPHNKFCPLAGDDEASCRHPEYDLVSLSDDLRQFHGFYHIMHDCGNILVRPLTITRKSKITRNSKINLYE